MNQTEVRVMQTLAPGGQLTLDQIARDAEISIRRARNSANSLARRGLAGIVGVHRNAWMLTAAGIRWAASSHGRAILDLPRR